MTATTPLTYNAYVTQIGVMAVEQTQTVSGVVSGVNAAFTAIIPQALNYAELRIQRDLDFLQSQVENDTYSVTPTSNQLSIAVGDFVTLQTMSINGAPLVPVTKEFIQNVYGSNALMAQPVYFAVYGGDLSTFGATYQNVLVGPWPDQTYPVVLTGTIRLPTLATYATNGPASTSTTYISAWYPDLLIQASMIYISQYQRNFAPTSNDPEMPGSYEAQYQALLKGAGVEVSRKKFQAAAWSSYSPAPVATPTRG
jgi:hypothetical protein